MLRTSCFRRSMVYPTRVLRTSPPPFPGVSSSAMGARARICTMMRHHKFLTATLVVLPVGSGIGLAAYIKYRAHTRPAPVQQRPLVTEEGTLVLQDITIPAPTGWAILRRILNLFLIFIPLIIMYPIMRRRENWKNVWMEWLLRSVERAGPAFIKAGQWSCTRRDLFSAEFRNAFQRLYADVKQHSLEETLQVLREDLHCDPEEIFSHIEPHVCGSGSIGQVHAAQLRSTGEKVVVKVMHPKIVETISTDFCIINKAARLFDRYFKSYEEHNFTKLALAFTNHLAAQLDFRLEAENLELFRERFKNSSYARFPRPFLSTHRVLVESFAYGHHGTNDFLAAQERDVRDILAAKGLNIYAKMLIRDNFMHGDLHPGNILIDVSNPRDPVITLIDVGLCQKIEKDEQPKCEQLLSSFVHWNPTLCADTLYSMGNQQRFANKEAFRESITKVFRAYKEQNKDTDHMVVSACIESVFDVIRQQRLEMEPAYVSLMFTVIMLESFINTLNPNFNMVRHVAPWLVSEGHVSKGMAKHMVKSVLWSAQTNARVQYLRARRLIGLDKCAQEAPEPISLVAQGKDSYVHRLRDLGSGVRLSIST